MQCFHTVDQNLLIKAICNLFSNTCTEPLTQTKKYKN